MSTAFALSLVLANSLCAQSSSQRVSQKIVLIAGETAKIDTVGHHDYIAGCKCLKALLQQTPNVECVSIENGWPSDEKVFDNAKAIVFIPMVVGNKRFSNRRVGLQSYNRWSMLELGLS